MNSKLAISKIVMFAGVMKIRALCPAMATKQPKTDVCHNEGEETDQDTGEITTAFWTINNINGHALNSHVDKHGDSTTADFVIETPEDDTACTALPNFQETVK